MSAAPAIEVRGLRKSYRGVLALRGFDLSVEAGETLALLGPNGAGKTTTVEILEGYRRQDSGSCRVLGLDPARDRARLLPLLGLMLQEGGVYPTLKVRESLRLFADFFVDPVDPAELLETVGLRERADTRFRQLSGGERQRLSLALALIGRPLLLFLDEPTAGMDPRARLLTWEIVEEARRRGTTVVLTTHAMEEAERLADRVAILHRGELVACDSPARLRAGRDRELLHLELEEPLSEALRRRLAELPAVLRVTELGGAAYDLRCSDPRSAASQVTGLLQEQGPQLSLLRLGRESLEETFLRLTGGGD